MKLREKIQKTTKAKEISVSWLAKRTGLQKTQISRYLKGVRDMQGENLDKLLKAIETHP